MFSLLDGRQQLVLNRLYYHFRGRKNAVKGKDLKDVFGLSNREVRRIVSELRSHGYPICSNTVDGYFFAINLIDVAETILDYTGRIKEMQGIVKALNVVNVPHWQKGVVTNTERKTK